MTALTAAAYACKYDDAAVKRIEEQVARINPRCSLYHRILGDALSGIRQYAASEAHYLAAIEMDRTDANARTELGMMYMQWGDESKARDALDAAWALDPYNERTKFTLELLDRLHKFARHETDLRRLMRSGADDDALAAAWRATMWVKAAGHGINDPDFVQPDRPMSAIGG